jgi:hypothetical protein
MAKLLGNFRQCCKARFIFSSFVIAEHRVRKTASFSKFIMDKEGNIIFGKRYNPNNPDKRAPHPTLLGGKDPQVQCAGIIVFRKGRILSVDNQSGHFRPDIKSLGKVDAALQKIYNNNPNLFDKDSKWRKQK